MITATEELPTAEEVTDPAELARAQERRRRFDLNLAWFEANAPEIYAAHRGKCICVAGQRLFVANSAEEAVTEAAAAHPEDDGRFILYIPKERMFRIYAYQRRVAPVSGRDRAAGDPR
jgi:hypothetical protein